MIIGICGRKRSGKDTIAQYITRQWGFKKYDSAEPIRYCCRIIFGWSEDWVENHKEEIDPFWGISYGTAAQLIGTDLFRGALPELTPTFRAVTGDKIWIKRMQRMCGPETDWVIPDVRYPNEAKAIQEMEGLVLRVERKTNLFDNHASENGIYEIEPDGVVYNYGTVDMLKEQVEKFMEETYARHQ